MTRLKKRQKVILRTLKDLGGVATNKQIAEKAEMNINGVSQTLSALSIRGYVKCAPKFTPALWKITLKGIIEIVIGSKISGELKVLLKNGSFRTIEGVKISNLES